MTQRSMHWDGARLGDADSLTVNAADGIGWRMSNAEYESPFVDRMSRALWNGTGNRGVLYNWNNELAVTGVASPISIDTGAAIVYGLFYENTSLTTKAIATPTNTSRYDYVVVRRDWSAQTARITVITGVEGGGIPALTQSPAPSGSGIYDIPLATLEVDTGGNITVTDAREYCEYSTSFPSGSIGTVHIANDSITFAKRATRTRMMFLGGGDLQPNVNAGLFAYAANGVWTQVGPPPWGGGAANEEAWRTTGISGNRRGLYATFMLPADMVPETWATVLVWWVNNAAVATNFYITTGYQIWGSDYSTVGIYGEILSSQVTSSGVASDVYTTPGAYITANSSELTGAVHYYVSFYNTAGTEDIGIMGLQIIYTGYT